MWTSMPSGSAISFAEVFAESAAVTRPDDLAEEEA